MGVLDNIKKTIERYAPEPFDPSVFDDELATKTDWRPLFEGGTSNTTYSFNKVSPRRAEFRAHGNVKLTSTLFIIVGAGLVAAMLLDLFDVDMPAFYAALAFGAFFIFIGIKRLQRLETPRIFDLDNGHLWIGKEAPKDDISTDTQCCLDEIHAIQLLHERCRSAGDSASDYFYSYEMNLVLQDGQRFNVVDHGHLTRIRNDADSLSRFLDVPVWDAIPDYCY